jgi:hypothetical protein
LTEAIELQLGEKESEAMEEGRLHTLCECHLEDIVGRRKILQQIGSSLLETVAWTIVIG